MKITAESSSHPELEISMMGSGFLQVMEIFSTIEYRRFCSNGAVTYAKAGSFTR